MTFDALRRRLFDRGTDSDTAAPDASEAGTPSARYDRMDAEDVNAQLRRHSQVELEEIETHERSHQNRNVVLSKLRYLRGKEPLPGYDKLEAGEVSAALRDADPETIKAVREYERKFRKRPDVLKELEQLGRARRSTLEAEAGR